MARREEVGIDMIAKDLATREIQQVGRSLEGMTKQAEETSKGMGFLQNAITGVFQGLGQMVFQKIQQGLAMVSDMIVGFNAKMEQARIGFTTMLGSAQKADQFIEELLDFSKRTPFQFEGLQKSANLIMAMGFAAEEVIPLLTAAGDAVAALGAGEDAVFRVVYALGQMRAAGRVTGQDMMQLASIGIPAWKMLAESMGLTVQQAKAMAEAGKIDAEDAIKAITEAIENGNMGGMMEAQAKTFTGAMSTINDSVTVLVSQAFQPLFQILSDAANALATFLSSEDAIEFGASVTAALKAVTEALTAAIKPLIEYAQLWLEHINVWAPVIALWLGVKLAAAVRAFVVALDAGALAARGFWAAVLLGIPFLLEFNDAANEYAKVVERTNYITGQGATGNAALATSFYDLFMSMGTSTSDAEYWSIQMSRLGISTLSFAKTAQASGQPVLAFASSVLKASASGKSLTETYHGLAPATAEADRAWQEFSGNVADNAEAMGISTEESLRGVLETTGDVKDGWEGHWQEMAATMNQETTAMAFDLKAFTAGLPSYMTEAVQGMLDAAKPWGEGLHLVLQDGTQIFAADVGALAQMLPDKINKGITDSVIAARTAPGRIGGAILDSISEWTDIGEKIAEAFADAMSPVQAVAAAQGLLASGALQAAFASGNKGLIDTVGQGYQDALSTLATYDPDFFTTGYRTDEQLRAGAESGLQLLADAGDLGAQQILDAWHLADTEMATAGAQAAHQLWEGADTQFVTDKPAMNTSVNTFLAVPTTTAYNYGFPIGSWWVKGIIGGISSQMYALELMMGSLKKIMEGGSPPPEGPLQNVDIGGFNIGEAWVLGMVKGIGESAPRLARSMGGLFPKELGGPMTGPAFNPADMSGGGGFGIGAGSPSVTIVNQFGPDSVRSERDIQDISRQTAERVRLLGVGLAQGQVGAIS